MATSSRSRPLPTLVSRYAIRRFARQIVEKFSPDKIILFGSYAYGTPNPDSDVDMLVVMPTRDTFNQAVNIRMAIEYRFSLDLLVRTPKELAYRLKLGDQFMREIVSRGKVLYEKANVGMGAKAEADTTAARKLRRSVPPVHDVVCFHCQQSAEKYMKGLLQERELKFLMTHE